MTTTLMRMFNAYADAKAKAAGDDAEVVHLWATKYIKVIQHVPPLLKLIGWLNEANVNPKPYEMCGITFANRVGLAAGFDKQGEMLPFIQEQGFGFTEIGGVNPHYQPGNPRPRLFRISEREALINAFGFNSDGVDEVEHRVEKVATKIRIPIFISPGRMKGTPNDRAVDDYIAVWERLRPYGAICVANISSPNTPGLRELQGGRYLERFIRRLVQAEQAMTTSGSPKPIFVKFAPDLSDQEMDEIAEAMVQGGASGLVMGNTTSTRPFDHPLAEKTGGWSGGGTFDESRRKFYYFRKKLPNLPMIYVGGLDAGYRARIMIDEGADLVELMTHFIYQGPRLVLQSRRAIEA